MKLHRYDPSGIRKYKAPKKEKTDVLRHPLVVIVFGFLLTGIVGGSISRYYEHKSEEQLETKRRMEFVKRIPEAAVNYYLHLEAIINSIRSQYIDESLPLKIRSYEEAKLLWEKEMLLTISTALNSTANQFAYLAVNQMVLEETDESLKMIDFCLNKAITKKEPDQKNKALNECATVNSPAENSIEIEINLIAAKRCIKQLQYILREYASYTDNDEGAKKLFESDTSCKLQN